MMTKMRGSRVSAAIVLLVRCCGQVLANVVQPGDGIVGASQTYPSSSSSAYAFDDDYTTRWLAYMAPNDAPAPFIGFQFTNGTSHVVQSYRICNLSLVGELDRSPKAFSLQGSNDGSVWTVLGQQTDQTNWIAQASRTYTCANSTAYSYFRLVITANNGDPTFTGLNELELFDGPTPPPLIAYEGFEGLSFGALNGQGGTVGGWTAPWGALSQVSVTNISLSYKGGDVRIEGGSKAMCIATVDSYDTVNRQLPEQAGDVVYLSALVRSKSTGSQKMLTLGLQNAASLQNSSSAGFDFGYDANAISAEVNGSSARARTSTGVTAVDDTTFFIVARVSRYAGNSGLYARSDVIVNPTTLTEPLTGWATATYTPSTFLTLINRINSRTFSMEAGQAFYMDEIRVGLTYEAVVPAFRDPGTLVIVK